MPIVDSFQIPTTLSYLVLKFNNNSFSVSHSDDLLISLHQALLTLSLSLSAKSMTVSSAYFIILDWVNSRTMWLENITKTKDPNMELCGTPENNGFG